MSWKTTKLTISLLAVSLTSPVAVLATPPGCAGAPSARSYTWDFHRETTQLLDRVQTQAKRIVTDADTLAALTRNRGGVSWESHAIQLNEIRDNVNKMGTDLCRLQAIRGAALPWQQQVIDRIVPRAVGLAESTESAIGRLNDNQSSFQVRSEYAGDVRGIFDNADVVAKSTRQFTEYARASEDAEKIPVASGM